MGKNRNILLSRLAALVQNFLYCHIRQKKGAQCNRLPSGYLVVMAHKPITTPTGELFPSGI